jgi:hypothetical protein
MSNKEVMQQALEALKSAAIFVDSFRGQKATQEAITALQAELEQPEQEPKKLWLWKNFVDGKPEYWAFDNAFPVHLECDDPQTLGEPCGYAIFKPSREGRTDIIDGEVLLRIKKVAAQRPWVGLDEDEILDLFDRNNVYGSKWIEFARTVEAKLKERNNG